METWVVEWIWWSQSCQVFVSIGTFFFLCIEVFLLGAHEIMLLLLVSNVNRLEPKVNEDQNYKNRMLLFILKWPGVLNTFVSTAAND